ncbi:hypothetical protein [Pyrobaculum neutrophilum]|uniref:Uncharacterized protein n=1 Tax=Pyrobaculum neutrophilum (strain DSM 2338 / JCM 9278 / NBRC 100436 / V24Sta) TaxID=444157 RepID=B1YC72_PYRNV|nr:hypothetical protein [Pyrobaculum neutrophilum]ACB39385.1 hypothetical protein Tneu_0437 [Pyrobaculum neutrophilum V24Sta]
MERFLRDLREFTQMWNERIFERPMVYLPAWAGVDDVLAMSILSPPDYLRVPLEEALTKLRRPSAFLGYGGRLVERGEPLPDDVFVLDPPRGAAEAGLPSSAAGVALRVREAGRAAKPNRDLKRWVQALELYKAGRSNDPGFTYGRLRVSLVRSVLLDFAYVNPNLDASVFNFSFKAAKEAVREAHNALVNAAWDAASDIPWGDLPIVITEAALHMLTHPPDVAKRLKPKRRPWVGLLDVVFYISKGEKLFYEAARNVFDLIAREILKLRWNWRRAAAEVWVRGAPSAVEAVLIHTKLRPHVALELYLEMVGQPAQLYLFYSPDLRDEYIAITPLPLDAPRLRDGTYVLRYGRELASLAEP